MTLCGDGAMRVGVSVRTASRLLLAGLVAASMLACSPANSPSPNPTGAGSGFQMYILSQRWGSQTSPPDPGCSLDGPCVPIGYEYEHSWQVLQKVSLSNPLLAISIDDIASYNWRSQEITLTRAGSDQFARIIRPTWDGDAIYYDGLWPNDHIFVAALDGKREYGGIFLYRGMAQAARFPLILTDGCLNPCPITSNLQPSDVWNAHLQLGLQSDSPEIARIRARIAKPEIKAYFEAHGKLIE